MQSPALEGPYFDDLAIGQEFSGAPGLTLTSGLAAAHQAITGDRLALALDHELCRQVTGGGPIASPSLVWDVAIGQSTLVTQHVRANLFYRGLAFHRTPRLGDTLRTSTRVVALRQNRPRAGRAPTGLAVLRITTADQQRRPVLDFWRCAMLPLRDQARQTGHADELEAVGYPAAPASLQALVGAWRLDRLARQAAGPRYCDLRKGQSWPVAGGDVVSSAPELARLTLNVAMVHHDAAASGGRRLVYGGHVVGLALAQAVRSLPGIATVAAWDGCDHLAPVHEGDTLYSTISVEQADDLPGGGGLVHLRSQVRAEGPGGPDDTAPRDVLDWRYVAVVA
jgi:acyl dehydratase